MEESDIARAVELERSQGVLPVHGLSDLSNADLGDTHTVALVVDEHIAERAQELHANQASGARGGEEGEHYRKLSEGRPVE